MLNQPHLYMTRNRPIFSRAASPAAGLRVKCTGIGHYITLQLTWWSKDAIDRVIKTTLMPSSVPECIEHWL